MKISITVNSLAPEDYQEWVVLWRGYLEFYQARLDDNVTEKTWERLLSPSVDMHALCARTDAGKIVGIVHYLFHPVTWSVSDRCYLEDLFVAESIRGGDVGKALIEAVYRAGEQRNADQVYWLTAKDNVVARRLYDRVGQLTPFIKYCNRV